MGKKWFYTGLDGIYLAMQLTDWLLVEVALPLIGLTQISFVKVGFDRLERGQSSFRLSARALPMLFRSSFSQDLTR